MFDITDSTKPSVFNKLGISGKFNRVGSIYYLPLDCVFETDIDEPREIGDVYPGDKLVLLSQTTVSPSGVVLLSAAHPILYRNGIVSINPILDETHSGVVSVFFDCKVKFNLNEINNTKSHPGFVRLYFVSKLVQSK